MFVFPWCSFCLHDRGHPPLCCAKYPDGVPEELAYAVPIDSMKFMRGDKDYRLPCPCAFFERAPDEEAGQT